MQAKKKICTNKLNILLLRRFFEDTPCLYIIMSKNLVIVESPHKAETIGKFLGNDYHVMSSQGHVRDIEPIGKNSLGIDFEHGYEPHYAIEDKKEYLNFAHTVEELLEDDDHEEK